MKKATFLSVCGLNDALRQRPAFSTGNVETEIIRVSLNIRVTSVLSLKEGPDFSVYFLKNIIVQNSDPSSVC